MTGLNDRLTRQIDTALLVPSFDGSQGEAKATLAELFALTNDYLGMAVPADARAAASGVAAGARQEKLGGEAEAGFRESLLALRNSLAEQKELEATTNQLAADPEMVQEFLMEAREHLATVEAGMLRLERNTQDSEALHSVFRSFHTIKGLAGFLGACAIQELAHETESVLDLARSGKLPVSAELTDLILRSADELTRCLEAAGKQPLNTLPRCNTRLLDSLADMVRGSVVRDVVQPDIVRAVPKQLESVDPAPESVSEGGAPVNAARAAAGSNVLRVDAAKLEYLVDMVGELVIAESVVRNDASIAASDDPLLSRNLAQLARVVKEVQKTSMSMRMVAVGTLFVKMARLVRDLSRKSRKNVELVTVGDEVELDRSIVDELADPMIHMIRNAVDHGLETPEERLKAGKPERGIVHIKAMHEAGDIVIELSDDGRGLNAAKILAKARRQGLVGEAEQRDDESVFPLIFEPGFSTADVVTDISGRGVGMDVVRKKIQKLRGRVTIRSVAGQGCTFVIRLPLTLAIIDGLVIRVGSQRYILPMFAVREMFSPKPDTFVTLENRVEAAMFREKLLPVIRLSRLMDGNREDEAGGVLIVAEGRDQLYCIAVDQLIGKQEVVVKSLGKTYRDVRAISGGAILGDGRVGLVIDLNSLGYMS
ncbi:MAG TPA: chemotaxis protein CheA [Bryobacteraceae bacterium]|jgi:two-component system chemotaxis sensor kinase CheA|nr:chemotaxis protein CheA [Bryobacteraceae bacterium]